MSAASFTVCLATYNGAAFLREQIDSVLMQLSEGDELLVSDDGSTDDTLTILESYGARVRLVGTERVGGVVANFERVLSAACGDLVALCDQDDVWLPGRLEVLRTALADADLAMTDAWIVNSELVRTGEQLFTLTRPSTRLYRNLRKNTFVGCCIAFRRTLLRQVLPFPSSTPWHDWLLGLFACAHGRVVFIGEPQLLYRRHGGNFSNTGGRSGNALRVKLALRIRIVRALLVLLCRRRFRALL